MRCLPAQFLFVHSTEKRFEPRWVEVKCPELECRGIPQPRYGVAAKGESLPAGREREACHPCRRLSELAELLEAQQGMPIASGTAEPSS